MLVELVFDTRGRAGCRAKLYASRRSILRERDRSLELGTVEAAIWRRSRSPEPNYSSGWQVLYRDWRNAVMVRLPGAFRPIVDPDLSRPVSQAMGATGFSPVRGDRTFESWRHGSYGNGRALDHQPSLARRTFVQSVHQYSRQQPAFTGGRRGRRHNISLRAPCRDGLPPFDCLPECRKPLGRAWDSEAKGDCDSCGARRQPLVSVSRTPDRKLSFVRRGRRDQPSDSARRNSVVRRNAPGHGSHRGDLHGRHGCGFCPESDFPLCAALRSDLGAFDKQRSDSYFTPGIVTLAQRESRTGPLA